MPSAKKELPAKRHSKQEISFGELETHIGFHIRRCHTWLQRAFAPFGREHNLKTQQFSILVIIQENPGIAPASVAEAIDIKRSLMAVLAEDLETRKLIRCSVSTGDRRHKQYFITAYGKKFITRLSNSLRSEIEPNLTRNLSDRELQTLLEILPKIYRA